MDNRNIMNGRPIQRGAAGMMPMIECAAEPPFVESFIEEMREGSILDAAREAVVGLPFALVWLVRRNR